MTPMNEPDTGFFDPEACDLSTFETLIDRTTDVAGLPHAAEIAHNVPTYDVAALRDGLNVKGTRRQIMAEWAHVLRSGAGIIVLRNAYADTAVLDKATAVYESIIAAEKLAAGGGGDHFAAAGSNDRIWNSLQKLCEAAPEVFLHYFANTAIAAASEAWLGPNYQMTAQINLVHPGGGAQLAHRDYHLGFQTADISADYPAHVHDLSPALTLQGAVAHCDMPVESGPTKLLPFSQLYRAGYTAWRRDDFRALFEERYIQLPLAKGDALFFNPAVFTRLGPIRVQIPTAWPTCFRSHPHLDAQWKPSTVKRCAICCIHSRKTRSAQPCLAHLKSQLPSPHRLRDINSPPT